MAWLDHLSSIFVGAVVLTIGIGLSLMSAKGAREDVQVHAGTAMRDAIAEQVTIDFENMGAGRLAGEPAVVSYGPDHVRFRSVSDTTGTFALVEYRLAASGTIDGVPVYSLGRYVDGVYTGGSARGLTDFDLAFRDASGAEVPATSHALRAVDVWFKWAIPFGAEKGAHVKSVTWGSTVHPAPLRNGS